MGSKGWRDTTPRFSEERKPHVARPVVPTLPKTCWCGEQHAKRGQNPDYWWAGEHPWPPLDDPEGSLG